MADYIYLLENRLSVAQRNALRIVRELARSRNLTVFLVGGAVRDLTSGSPVRDLDVVVQGNALKLKKDIEKLGAVVTGEIEAAQALFLSFAGGVSMEFGSTLSVTFPKPGKPIYKPSSILDDLRRRDFTANAMALSLNEGSYGLLMDPLNGVADIENRELRLVSNYGFIEDPSRMIRAARLMARLGWAMDEKTQQRYNSGKEEDYISALNETARGYETEEVVHEEDPLRVLKRLEAEGWMKYLASFWTSAKADVAALEALRETQTQLQMQGIYPDAAAANFPLLTAKLAPRDVATLKASFVRQGFVQEIDSLETKARDLATLLTGKAAAKASDAWKILTSAPSEAVLWVAYSTKSAALKEKFKNFYTVWPQARQKMPYLMMQEMRIVPDLAGYDELVEKLFFELMDDKLQSPEEMKAFLEPFSPPAPPPPVSLRRPRAAKKETKASKARAKKAAIVVDPDNDESSEELDDVVIEALDELTDDDSSDGAKLPVDDDADEVDSDDDDEDDDDDDPRPKKPSAKAPVKTATNAAPVKAPAKVAVKAAPAKTPAAPPVKAPAKTPTKTPTKTPARTAVKAIPTPPAKKAAPVKAVPAKKSTPQKAIPAKKEPVKIVAKKAAVKAPVKVAKKAAVPAKKIVPAKKAVVKKTAPPAKKAAVKKPAPPVKKVAANKAPVKISAPIKKTSPSKKPIPAKKRR